PSEPNPSISLITSTQIGRSTGSNFSHNSSHKNKEAVDITGKSISSYIDDWCNRKIMVVKYGPEHYELQEGARIRSSQEDRQRKRIRQLVVENGSKKKSSNSDSEEASESDDDLLVGNAGSNNGSSGGKRRKKTAMEVEEQVKKTVKGNKSDNGLSKNGSEKKFGDSDSEDSSDDDLY
ncbi:Uncharacterized protein APZ42_007561, partial [Daphnia magna]